MTDPLMEIIQGEKKNNLNRQEPLVDNIAHVRSEFVGKPEVCHQLVTHIIHLRRQPDHDVHRLAFYGLLNTHRAVLLKELDIRWLLSVCDTIVDVGTTTSSAIAMNIVQCINNINIQFAISNGSVDGTLDYSKMAGAGKFPTWGGMISPDCRSGDMIHNMMCRMDTVIKHDSLLWDIWCEIKDRSRHDNTLLINWVCRLNINHDYMYFFQPESWEEAKKNESLFR